MNATTTALWILTLFFGCIGGTAFGDDTRPAPANTLTVEAERARPIVENWRNGKGWAFATTRTESGGRRFVRYRVLVGIDGSLTVGGKTQVLMKLSPETEWIPIDVISLPVLGGSARDLLREAQIEIDRPRNAVTPAEAAALAGTLPQLIKTIEPTVKGPNPVPPRVDPIQK